MPYERQAAGAEAPTLAGPRTLQKSEPGCSQRRGVDRHAPLGKAHERLTEITKNDDRVARLGRDAQRTIALVDPRLHGYVVRHDGCAVIDGCHAGTEVRGRAGGGSQRDEREQRDQPREPKRKRRDRTIVAGFAH